MQIRKTGQAGRVMMTSSRELDNFIRAEKYLQNPPLDSLEFIREAKKRGMEIAEADLELLEKHRLLFPVFRIDRPIFEEERIKFMREGDSQEWERSVADGLQRGERETGRHTVRLYSSYGFDDHSNRLLVNWLEEGSLYDPRIRPFRRWSTFKGERLLHSGERTMSFYAIFHLHWLAVLKASAEDGRFTALNSGTKKRLRSNLRHFERVLWLLLDIQTVFYPLSRSGARSFQLTGDLEKWRRIRLAFNPDEERVFSGMSTEGIAAWYQTFSRSAIQLLGGDEAATFDWIQLWKAICWRKKEKLSGDIRLGIDYLQWAHMLKGFLGLLQNRQILDVDEVSRLPARDLLDYDPAKTQNGRASLRDVRNQRHYDAKTKRNFYQDTYKRLFYQANAFEIDYQPRLLLLVEGDTEEGVFPLLFAQYYAPNEDLGIQILNLKGINKLFGQEISVRNENTRKYRRLFVSNFSHLINYNLEQWQTIPFLLGDNEGMIRELLRKGKVVSFEGQTYAMPTRWYHLWDKDFELDNFSDEEISKAISSTLGKKVSCKDVELVRKSGKGISAIDTGAKDEIARNKVRIGERLVDTLLAELTISSERQVLERPIFTITDRLINLAVLNHMPTDREHELMTRGAIRKWLGEGTTDH